MNHETASFNDIKSRHPFPWQRVLLQGQQSNGSLVGGQFAYVDASHQQIDMFILFRLIDLISTNNIQPKPETKVT